MNVYVLRVHRNGGTYRYTYTNKYVVYGNFIKAYQEALKVSSWTAVRGVSDQIETWGTTNGRFERWSDGDMHYKVIDYWAGRARKEELRAAWRKEHGYPEK